MKQQFLLILILVISLVSLTLGQYSLRTIAGTGIAGDISGPIGVWTDTNGNIYVASGGRVRLISSSGIITTFLGGGFINDFENYEDDGTPAAATAVQLDGVFGIYGNSAGTIYLSSDYYFVWKYSSGNVSRYAGIVPASLSFSGDTGQATSAELYYPRGIYLSSSGFLYIADSYNNRIRVIDTATGIINTVVGSGNILVGSFGGDNGPATSATLWYPNSVWMNTEGTMYIADTYNYRIRKVNVAGIIYTFAGTGNITYNNDNIPATSANLNGPTDVKGDSTGNIYIAESDGCRIRVISTIGIISTIIGTGTCGPATTSVQLAAGATIGYVLALWVDSQANIYFTEYSNHYVRYLYSTPTVVPTAVPSISPTLSPSTVPSVSPTMIPSVTPSASPTVPPTALPTASPTVTPSVAPTASPTVTPTATPSACPTYYPTSRPSGPPTTQPSCQPSRQPSRQPTGQPSNLPSRQPSSRPSGQPSGQPTIQPSRQPSGQPSGQPSSQPTNQPSSQPSGQPSSQPSGQPTVQPTLQPSGQPSVRPSRQPNGQPTMQPSTQPSGQPTTHPTVQPSVQPTSQPSSRPSGQPSSQPTNQPSSQPSGQPSSQPSDQPTVQPSSQPSGQPSVKPSGQPSSQPSSQPTKQPSSQPSGQPTVQPTLQPSGQPSVRPSRQPNGQPTMQPSTQPTTQPTVQPSVQPTSQPSSRPSGQPSSQPSRQPSSQPSVAPTSQPTAQPTGQPTHRPSGQPSSRPTGQPSVQPFSQPSEQPSSQPSSEPSGQPSSRPTVQPSSYPSGQPTDQPTMQPSCQPSAQPTSQPSEHPTRQPSSHPSGQPSSRPSMQPSAQPSIQPTGQPSSLPSSQPTRQPSSLPSGQPSGQPTDQPTTHPSGQPSVQPSSQPSSQPTGQPSRCPTSHPSCVPSVQPTTQPSGQPSVEPTSNQPTGQPSGRPSDHPSGQPTAMPSCQPSCQPTGYPSSQPSVKPTGQPTAIPSQQPSRQPSTQPSCTPSSQPTGNPSLHPTYRPTQQPSSRPSAQPSSAPSGIPSSEPSNMSTGQPTCHPSNQPSNQPSGRPSAQPSSLPTLQPTSAPIIFPTVQPTGYPSSQPSTRPTMISSVQPSNYPTGKPSIQPTNRLAGQPSDRSSSQPTSRPSGRPTTQPSYQPTGQPTLQPSNQPTGNPSRAPSEIPSKKPTTQPTGQPSVQPSSISSRQPIGQPSSLPSSQPIGQPTMTPSVLQSYHVSSFKDVVCLFGSYSLDQAFMKTLDISSPSEGVSSIVFGGRSLSSAVVIDATYPTSSFQYPVAHVSPSYRRDSTCRSAVVPGDLNGDGYNDLVVCYAFSSSCYIYFGNGEDGLMNMKIEISMYGPTGSLFGFSVAGAEDLNQDGYVDVIISALRGKTCYVVYGRRSWTKEVKLSTMRSGKNTSEGADGYKILADASTSLTGVSVAGLGDMNGDGKPDLAISVQKRAFVVYVILEGGKDMSLSEVENGVKGFRVFGEEGYYTGLSISRVGDVNQDGFADIVIGAVPYPGREKSQVQKSYVILGSSVHTVSYIVLGPDVVGKGVVMLLGGGYIVSGPGDVNGDGIEDIMITDVRDYQGSGNTYIISYPAKMSSPPTLLPSSRPSSRPSQLPSSEPSSSSPTHSPTIALSSLMPSSSLTPSVMINITSNDSLSQKPWFSFSPSIKPSIHRASKSPSIRPSNQPTTSAPSLLPTLPPTRTPSRRPTAIQTKMPTIPPSRRSSSIISSHPSFLRLRGPSPAPSSSSSEYIVRYLNSSSVNKQGIVNGRHESNEIYEISSMSRDGKSRSGWSGTIIGRRGKKIYRIYPKDPSEPMNRIILQDFDRNQDIIDLSRILHVWSKSDLTYLTHPLSIFLPDNQRIILATYQTISQVRESNFLFHTPVSLKGPSSPSKDSAYELFLNISFLVPVVLVVVCIVLSYFCKEENSRSKKRRQSEGEICLEADEADKADDAIIISEEREAAEGVEGHYLLTPEPALQRSLSARTLRLDDADSEEGGVRVIRGESSDSHSDSCSSSGLPSLNSADEADDISSHFDIDMEDVENQLAVTRPSTISPDVSETAGCSLRVSSETGRSEASLLSKMSSLDSLQLADMFEAEEVAGQNFIQMNVDEDWETELTDVISNLLTPEPALQRSLSARTLRLDDADSEEGGVRVIRGESSDSHSDSCSSSGLPSLNSVDEADDISSHFDIDMEDVENQLAVTRPSTISPDVSETAMAILPDSSEREWEEASLSSKLSNDSQQFAALFENPIDDGDG